MSIVVLEFHSIQKSTIMYEKSYNDFLPTYLLFVINTMSSLFSIDGQGKQQEKNFFWEEKLVAPLIAHT